MHTVPDFTRSPRPSTIRFQVSEAMIQAFAKLTGDRSALHVSGAFARRSAFRRPVAHGMLPVGFIALLDCLRIDGLRCLPVALTGHFSAPVYAGDRLLLSAEPAEIRGEKGPTALSYIIRNEISGAIVTRGMIRVVYAHETPAKRSPTGNASTTMLPNPPDMHNARLEDIAKGQTDEFQFRITDENLRDFANILTDGAGESLKLDLKDFRDHFCLPNLLSIFLFSTSVGVCLPGASATFLEFSVDGNREIELDTTHQLSAKVIHLSRSTRIVKKHITISKADRNDEALLHGAVLALVNEPPRMMPTIRELKASALDMGLKDKVVLITGASRGIGETTAKLFSLLGAKVIVNYHRGAEDAQRIVSEISADGGEAIAVPADVTRPEAVSSLIQLGVKKYGSIHVLVNNAARDFRPIPFLELTWEEIQKDLDVIGKGAFLCSQHVIPLMVAQGGGKIINISSVAVDNPPIDQTKYVMAKSALMGLTRCLSIEFASKNVQVNLVVPNFVDTDLVAHVPEGFKTKIARETPMGRLGSPIEVAQAIVFLASSLCSFTTGQKIMITGGGAPYL